MDERVRVGLVVAATVGLFLAVQLGALSLAPELQERGYQATDDPQDATNSVVYIGVILAATAGMLLAIRLGLEQVIRAVVLLTSGLLSWYVLGVVLGKALGGILGPATVGWLALGLAVAVPIALLVHPEWYVIDAAGVVMGAGAAGLFGISFGIGPALVLLVGLAVYDAISVYGTEHMLTLAEGVMDLDIPVVLVIPTTLAFSMASVGSPDEATDGPPVGDPEDGPGADEEPGDGPVATEEADGRGADDDPDFVPRGDDGPGDGPRADDDPDGPVEAEEPAGGRERDRGPLERDALFVGLGDAIVPAVLVASAGFFLRSQAPPLVDGLALNVPALGAMIGTTVGLLVLLRFVIRGRPHAGLPLLNGGAIAGYLVGALAAGIPLASALGL